MDWADSEIIEAVRAGGPVAQRAVERTGLTRVTISRRLARLVERGFVVRKGAGTRPTYSAGDKLWWQKRWERQALATDGEGEIWLAHLAPIVTALPPNVRNIVHIGFTEMLNNAIDHAQATHISCSLLADAEVVQIAVVDDGVGIFRRIADHLKLPDRRLAILELAKGKFTTAAEGHSGMGVFVCSRMFDRFTIHSDGLVFTHDHDFTFDWLDAGHQDAGTTVLMEIARHSPRTSTSVYDRYFDPDQSGPDAFLITEVPLRLAALGSDLVSRSQGKWVTARIDQFRRAILDFEGVTGVGQGFVDEVFRVFALAHPQVDLVAMNMSDEVARVVKMFAPRTTAL